MNAKWAHKTYTRKSLVLSLCRGPKYKEESCRKKLATGSNKGMKFITMNTLYGELFLFPLEKRHNNCEPI